VVESAERVGFLLKTGALRENFDGDATVEPRVVSPVDFSHAAFAEFGRDFVVAELHGVSLILDCMGRGV
jgi:hypothetical protein